MNDNSIRYPVSPVDRLDEKVRANPTNALLIAAGIGFAVALLIKSARPKSPTDRLHVLLEDLQGRLDALARPTARRASSLAESGAAFLDSTRDDVRSTIGDAVREGRRYWKGLFA